METREVKQTLHQLIDQTKDEELLLLCVQLLEREIRKESDNSQHLFKTSPKELISRAEHALKSISAGKTRNIKEFKREIDQWKKSKSL